MNISREKEPDSGHAAQAPQRHTAAERQPRESDYLPQRRKGRKGKKVHRVRWRTISRSLDVALAEPGFILLFSGHTASDQKYKSLRTALDVQKN